MSNIENMDTRRLEKIGHSAATGRLSPIDTFQRTCELMTNIQNGQIEQFQEFVDSYKQSLQQWKETSQMMTEVVNALNDKKSEVKELRNFLDRKGLLKEYERTQYKRLMNAVYRRADRAEGGE